MVVIDKRMAASADPLPRGKPAVLVTARGGVYGPGTPRDGRDHATPFMQRILRDSWGLDLRVVESEFTLVEVNPALAQFKDLAAKMKADAERLAHESGRDLAAVVSERRTSATTA